MKEPDSPLSDSTFASSDDQDEEILFDDVTPKEVAKPCCSLAASIRQTVQDAASGVEELLKKRMAKRSAPEAESGARNSWDGAYFDQLAAEHKAAEEATASYSDRELLNRTRYSCVMCDVSVSSTHWLGCSVRSSRH